MVRIITTTKERGVAFVKFGVSKQVNIGAPTPTTGSSLKVIFKVIGVHIFTVSDSIRPIKSKTSKSVMRKGQEVEI